MPDQDPHKGGRLVDGETFLDSMADTFHGENSIETLAFWASGVLRRSILEDFSFESPGTVP